ncbi:hypothetical protein K458DRAFT_384701 [Lentithecium fluviatile CBS 122367]|uniref:Uncharacterized protein n=1 Tax=Lentithecium fluviatile CBS 122367 TaxID=1168545 RepID=A0A6G1JEG7_9PLEO|nr:hypothetical protein K458DRAFT_384701 [Lentithecium fluviatile CBS 122367]
MSTATPASSVKSLSLRSSPARSTTPVPPKATDAQAAAPTGADSWANYLRNIRRDDEKKCEAFTKTTKAIKVTLITKSATPVKVTATTETTATTTTMKPTALTGPAAWFNATENIRRDNQLIREKVNKHNAANKGTTNTFVTTYKSRTR